jgi:hypothetical protein
MSFIIYFLLVLFPVLIYLILVHTDDPSLVVIPILGMLITSIISTSGTRYTKYYPVEYTTESTSFKVFVHTQYGEFESDKKINCDEFVQNKPGFIKAQYNYWNSCIYTDFTVHPLSDENRQ